MSTPAGWYANPDNDGRQRYWDGEAWTEHYAPGAPPPPPPSAPAHQPQATATGGPLMTFTSHIAGKNATVQIWNDRIEWAQAGRISATRVVTGAALVTGARKGGSTEMVPIRSITSISTKKDGLMNWAVLIGVPGNVIAMRVSKAEAETVKSTVQRLMLG